MKKIIGIIGAAAVAAGLFAVDFSATVKVTGAVANGDYSSKNDASNIKALTLYNTNPDNLLNVNFSGDRAGAKFGFDVDLTGAAKIGASGLGEMGLWFEPIDGLKVSLGSASAGLGFQEKIEWWKVARPWSLRENLTSWSWAGGFRYSSAQVYGYKSTVASGGVEYTGIPNLTVMAGFDTGTPGTAFYSVGGKSDDADWSASWTTTEWGVGAKYNLSELLGLNLTVGAAYQDLGRFDHKMASVGGAFVLDALEVRLTGMFDIHYQNGDSVKYYVANTGDDNYSVLDWGIRGVSLDNYIAYNFGFMNVQATIPLVIRFGQQHATNADGTDNPLYDPSYFGWKVKVSIPQDFGVLYVSSWSLGDVANEPGYAYGANAEYARAIILTDQTSAVFGMALKGGLEVKVGSYSLDIGAWAGFTRKGDGAEGKDASIYGPLSIEWEVPFTATVSF